MQYMRIALGDNQTDRTPLHIRQLTNFVNINYMTKCLPNFLNYILRKLIHQKTEKRKLNSPVITELR